MMKKHSAALMVMIAMVLVGSTAAAEVPDYLTYHGNLSTAAGEPVDDVVETTFRIFDGEENGEQVWEEDVGSVDVVDGSFTVRLGQTESLGEVFDGGSYWLEAEIGGERLAPGFMLRGS